MLCLKTKIRAQSLSLWKVCTHVRKYLSEVSWLTDWRDPEQSPTGSDAMVSTWPVTTQLLTRPLHVPHRVPLCVQHANPWVEMFPESTHTSLCQIRLKSFCPYKEHHSSWGNWNVAVVQGSHKTGWVLYQGVWTAEVDSKQVHNWMLFFSHSMDNKQAIKLGTRVSDEAYLGRLETEHKMWLWGC